MKTLAALVVFVAGLVFAPTARADDTPLLPSCVFSGVLVIISVAPVTLCSMGTDVTHTTDVSVDPKLFSRAP